MPNNPTPQITESGSFICADVHPRPELRVFNSIPLPIIKFVDRFATRCTLDCCGIAALVISPPSVDDGRWTILMQLENDLARLCAELENLSAAEFHFTQLNFYLSKTDALFLFRYFENGLRQVRAQCE